MDIYPGMEFWKIRRIPEPICECLLDDLDMESTGSTRAKTAEGSVGSLSVSILQPPSISQDHFIRHQSTPTLSPATITTPLPRLPRCNKLATNYSIPKKHSNSAQTIPPYPIQPFANALTYKELSENQTTPSISQDQPLHPEDPSLHPGYLYLNLLPNCLQWLILSKQYHVYLFASKYKSTKFYLLRRLIVSSGLSMATATSS
eukprot:GHVP01004922.1.p1 GENE.GHVP01004922.1~~GHVP01004922.1.p1  ORF type:complete len:203 (-),score=13.09 GHVP01004922.1:509-1117(-)